MAYKAREEIVGKRFLSVASGFNKLKLGKIADWGWRAGVIRAATHKDNCHKELQVLVEYDDVEWHRREWISIYKDGLFHMFMVEQGLCWAERSDPFTHSKASVVWPALTFSPLVATIDLNGSNQPVEFLLDRELSFADYKHLNPYKDWDSKIPGARDYPELRLAVKRWAEQQDGQRILLATPSVLVGYRVEVYRAEGTTQWYTAVIVGYNEATRDLTVTDDTVLEEHNEDPTLVQMRLIGDGVVESIMRGENVGITPRRSRSTVLQAQQQHHQQTGRTVRGLSSSGLHHGVHHHQQQQHAGAATTTVSQNTRKQRGALKPTAASSIAATAAATAAAQQHNHHHQHSQQQQQQAAHQHQHVAAAAAAAPQQQPASHHHNHHHNHQQPPLPPASTQSQHESIRCTPEETADPKVVTARGRKRKSSENESIQGRLRSTTAASYHHHHHKEDLENKQTRSSSSNKRTSVHNNRAAKKKILEEANNSKLREVQRDRAEPRLQNATSDDSTLSAVCRRSFEESVVAQVVPDDEATTIATTNTTPISSPNTNTSINNNNNNDDEEEDEVEEVVGSKERLSRTRQDSGSSSLGTSVATPTESTEETAAILVGPSSSSTINDSEELLLPSTDEVVKDAIPASEAKRDANDSALEDDTSNGSSVQLVVPVEDESIGDDSAAAVAGAAAAAAQEPTAAEVVSEEDDCVIVAQRTPPPGLHSRHHHHHNINNSHHHHRLQQQQQQLSGLPPHSPIGLQHHHHHLQHHHHHIVVERECSHRGDDDGPLSASSPFSSRMDIADTVAHHAALLRFPDDRSDSGVSSLRSGSGDERSGSRSSALSSSDDPPPSTASSSSSSSSSCAQSTRSPLFLQSSGNSVAQQQQSSAAAQAAGAAAAAAAASGSSSSSNSSEPVRVWRDPSLLLESEPHVRHIHSVQHQSLLMSHPSAPAASGPPPPTSASAAVAAAAAAAAAGHPAAALYAPMPSAPPGLMASHHVHPHALGPPGALYSHIPDPLIWTKVQRYPMPIGAHLLPPQTAHAEEMLERDRVYAQDRDRHERMLRERQNESREMEKREQEKREKHERLVEREREQREREKLDRDLNKHFEESLKRAIPQKNAGWNFNSMPPPARGNEEERKRSEQDHHQREQHLRQLSNVSVQARAEVRERAYYQQTSQRPPSIPSKAEYPPPAHSRLPPSSKAEKMASVHPSHPSHPKAELNMFGYPAYQPNIFSHEPKGKVSNEHHKMQNSGLIVTKSVSERERDRDRERERDMLPNPPPLMSELKNSVIVKHDAKSQQHHMEAASRVSIAHSPSPKLRGDHMGHYLQSPQGSHKGAMYEYRSPTQSPHHLPHAPSPHHHLQAENLGKPPPQSHHRSPGGQLPSPHHQRQSPHPHPHPHAQPHASPEMRYRSNVDHPTMIYAPNVKTSIPSSYPYMVPTTAVANAKPKVSSPAPHHIYGKPAPPTTRGHDQPPPGNPIPLTSKPHLSATISPSPYQQVSQYHPPHPGNTNMQNQQLPPPAHSSSAHSRDRPSHQSYDRMFTGGTVPGGLSVKQSMQHGTSPPTAASAPSPVGRIHPQYMPPGVTHPPQSIPSGHSVQTQPLDLGVSSNKYDSSSSPKRKASIAGGGGNSNMPVCLEVKKRRIEPPREPGPPQQQSQQMSHNQPHNQIQHQVHQVQQMAQNLHAQATPPLQQQQQQQQQPMQMLPHQNLSLYQPQQTQQTQPAQLAPQLSRVSEASPLVASVATTITTVVNTAAYRGPPATHSPATLAEVLPDVSVTPLTIPPTVSASNAIERPPSLESSSSVASTIAGSTNTSAITVPLSTATTTTAAPTTIVQEPPTTPVKPITPSSTCVSIDSEKSNSPVPTSKSTYPVRHLKKAWLQRHTGEDVEDTTGMIGSGSCVSLPLNLNNTLNSSSTAPAKEASPVTSLHNIGSMAVNSINKSKSFSTKANNRKAHKESVNGHPLDASKADDSSSSDQERGRKSPPKRKPPKVKRKKGGGAAKKAEEKKQRKVSGGSNQLASESGSDSDKESISDKDSDSGASTTVSTTGKKPAGATTAGSNNASATPTSGAGGGGGGTAAAAAAASKDKEPRKRGRRPKTKNDKGEEPRAKKSKDDLVPQRDPFRKPPVGQLRKTGESFLQDGPCFEVAPKLAKCRECRWTPNQRSKNMPNIFCRFYAFRKLRYTKNGQLAIAGFSDPHKDATEEDLKLWLPSPDTPPSDLDLETSRFLLKQVGDHFCNLLLQEKDAQFEHMSEDKTIAWKRVVQGVREMCDVCETTLFNFHWACGKCGFVVCLDCYKGRKAGTVKVWGEPGKDRDDFSWLLCTNRQAHEHEKLMLTQIIAGDCLLKLGRLVHEMRELWNVEQYCGCPISKEVTQKSNGQRKELIKSILSAELNGAVVIKKEEVEEKDIKSTVNGGGIKDEKSSLTWLADVALSNDEKKNEESSDDDSSFSTLRELLIRPSHKPNGSRAGSPVPQPPKKKSAARLDTLDEVISSVIEDSVPKLEHPGDHKELKHFVPRENALAKTRGMLPIRIMTLTESKLLYPDVPHSWLCDGKLLRLSDTTHAGNFKIFQDQWKRGQPVLVSDVSKHLAKDLWTPDAFSRDFGDEKNDLVNCMNGSILVNQPMRKFWEGFEHFTKRLKDDKGNPMLLKLKDWPPGEDFAEMLPSRFNDLMRVLPLSQYTHRNGKLNLASRLPECFVRPDLGPKMYIAYGSALHPSKGTTNLHLDISDAVNVMVHVGIPKDSDTDEHIKEAFRAIDEAGCDILTRRRVRDKGELPGALWHIYNARDADKIRDLLNKVVVEKGGLLKPNHDPIHDQSCYLDGPLRERLYKEYGVEGYAIVQCLGDAVFIPAGAPHQVRNLHNCIKVAEDFVSPENVSHCFHLTQEFRDLSETHSNHEDKLQIKNIIFHAIKDSLSGLTSIVNKHVKAEKDAEQNGNNGNDAQHSTTDSKAESA